MCGDTVSTATHRDEDVVVACEIDCVNHGAFVHALRDQGWALVDKPVPDLARVVVSVVVWSDEAAMQVLPESLEG
jgi:hypothetical protein